MLLTTFSYFKTVDKKPLAFIRKRFLSFIRVKEFELSPWGDKDEASLFLGEMSVEKSYSFVSIVLFFPKGGQETEWGLGPKKLIRGKLRFLN